MATIPLNEAMGLTPSMTPDIVSSQWVKWSTTYQEERNKLSPAVTGSLDALTRIIAAYKVVTEIIPTVETGYKIAQTAYKAGLALLPGIGALDGALTSAELGLQSLYKQAASLASQFYTDAIKLIASLTNFQVDSNARI